MIVNHFNRAKNPIVGGVAQLFGNIVTDAKATLNISELHHPKFASRTNFGEIVSQATRLPITLAGEARNFNIS